MSLLDSCSKSSSRLTLVLTAVNQLSVQRPSTVFVNLDQYVAHLLSSQLQLTSMVDYCNVLLAAGCSKTMTDKLQRVMNTAAWVMTSSTNVRPRFDPELPRCVTLAWCDRLGYVKLILMVYKTVFTAAPDYLSEFMHVDRQHCTAVGQHLRSTSHPSYCTCRVTVSAGYVRPLPYSWSDNVELADCLTTYEILT